MQIKRIIVGPLQVNCFIIADEYSKKAMVVDPGDEPDRIIDIINKDKLIVEYIVCTHGHFDHVGAVSDLKNITSASVLLHKNELEIYRAALDMAAFWGYELDPLPDPDVFIKEGDVIEFGNLKFNVLHTPGHSPGGICIYGEGIVITGDVIFAGSVGRTDFYGGDMNRLKDSFRRIMSLPEDTKMLPGHGPDSTIGNEKRENAFSKDFLD